MEKKVGLLQLFLTFIKFGFFTFGGGWSIVAQMQQEYCEKRQVITPVELLDLASVGRSVPGIMICNVSMLFGIRVAGLPGGVACLLGISLPSMCVLSVISLFYDAFRSNPWIGAAMTGIRAAVVPIVLTAAVKMRKNAFPYWPCVILMAIAIAGTLFLKLSPMPLILFGAVCGLLISAHYGGRGV